MERDRKLVDVEIMYQNQNQNQKYFNNPRGKLFNLFENNPGLELMGSIMEQGYNNSVCYADQPVFDITFLKF